MCGVSDMLIFMMNDIRPPQRIRPAAPVNLPPAKEPIQASKRFKFRPGALAAGGVTGLAIVVGTLSTGVMDQTFNASKRTHKQTPNKVTYERKAHEVHRHWNWRRLTSTPAPTVVEAPGVPDPVQTIPELVAIITPTPSPTPSPTPVVVAMSTADLNDPAKKDLAMQLVSSAENSSLNWRAQYGYIEDIGDGRGYTGGIIGFTSGTHDMLELVQYYAQIAPGNILSKYIAALQRVDGSASHSGLEAGFVADWKTAATDPKFQEAQNRERDRSYFDPAVSQAKSDGLHALGQFIYYDAIVMHGPGNSSDSFGGIRAKALSMAKPPSQGGNETTYLNAFLDARKAAMLTEAAHEDTSRVDTAQRVFLQAGNLHLNVPLSWKTYGDSYSITR